MADVPLSFPAVLRGPKLSDRFAHLHISSDDDPLRHCQRGPKKDRPEPEGKRWLRRRENAEFTHNPHVARPSIVDLALPLQLPSSTFPHPLPPCLPRSLPAPTPSPPPSSPQTSIAGLFSLSLRGARRDLRARPSSAYLVKAIESHLVAWLQCGTFLNPDQAKGLLAFPGDPVGGREDIREVAREAGRLVWAVKADSTTANRDGGFERYVVHCVARWHGIVSFSKETDGHRLTHLLRPNVTRPDPRAGTASRVLDTPPATDASDAGLSDFNASEASDSARSLSDIDESRSSSPVAWSVVGGPVFALDADDDADERGFTASMESLSLSAHDFATAAVDTTPAPLRLQDATVTAGVGAAADVEPEERGENLAPSRARADRDRLRAIYPRSTSSPSPARRSPHRLPTSRKLAARRRRKAKSDRKGFAGAIGTDKGTFYDFLFA